MKSLEEILSILAFVAVVYGMMELVVAHWAKIDKKKAEASGKETKNESSD